MVMAWYTKSAQEVAKELNTDIKTGIPEASAKTRAEKYGQNSRPGRHPKKIDPAVWRSAMLLPAVVFAAAAVLYILTKNYAAAVSIFLAAAVAAGAQARILVRAGRLLDSIRRITTPVSTVVRDGTRRVIDTSLLVPGDVVVLKPGDEIGADMRVAESVELKIDESPLPGGFISSRKNAADILDEDTELGARSNMCYCGCTVASGYGRAIVVETGEKVAYPQTQAALPKYEYGMQAETRQFLRVNRRLCAAGIILCTLTLIIGLLNQELSRDTLVSTILICCTLAAAAIPAGLGLAQTALLTSGMEKLARRGSVVKSMHAMEEINRVDTLVLPKTGVITSDEMTATVLWSGGKYYDISGRGWTPEGKFTDSDGREVDISRRRDAAMTLIAAALCANSDIEEVSAGQWVRRGDPTECALVTMAAKAGLFRADMNEMFPKIAELPFEPARRMMTSIHRRGRQAVAYSKGAPELVLACCDTINVSGRALRLTDNNRAQIARIFSRMAEQGLRVVAVAYHELGPLPENPDFDAGVEHGMTFLGLAGIENRVAHGSVAAFNLCESADIKTLMVTGDELGTTSDTALSLGIHEAVFDGDEIDSISPQELSNRLRLTRACARVTPQGRRAIIGAQKMGGSFVAAAGSQAADAQALRIADIGIALGAACAESTRQAAGVILDESSFSEITRVIEESRTVFSSLRAYSVFAMGIGFTALFAVLVCYLSGVSVAFSAVHFAWLHAVMALIPAFVLGDERNERSTMRTRPRMEGETAINRKSILCALVQALIPAGLVIASYFIASARGTAAGLADTQLAVYARTASFVCLMLCMLGLLFPSRSETTSLIRLGFASNHGLLFLSGGVLIMLILSVYVPFLQGAFDTAAIGWIEWLIALAFMAVTLAWGEVFKRVLRPLADRLIKITPKKTHRRARRIDFGEGFFSKFENADPTQEEEEPIRREGISETPVQQQDMEEPAPLDEQQILEEFGEPEDPQILQANASAPDISAQADIPANAPTNMPSASEASEAAQEPENVPVHPSVQDEATQEPETPADGFLSGVPDELKIYGDLFAALPKEILASGLTPAAGQAEPIELPVEAVSETDTALAQQTGISEAQPDGAPEPGTGNAQQNAVPGESQPLPDDPAAAGITAGSTENVAEKACQTQADVPASPQGPAAPEPIQAEAAGVQSVPESATSETPDAAAAPTAGADAPGDGGAPDTSKKKPHRRKKKKE